MHDRFKKPFRADKADDRVRRQIALEAARRLPKHPDGREPTDAEFYVAKRKAAAVLGHRVRPGDLPSDDEVRVQLGILNGQEDGESDDDDDEPPVPSLADHLDRFTLYKIRLEPLESVKQNVLYHPEGDALYHSLQVFERSREVRPYDEEFLLAALLHDIGKAIDPRDHVAAALDALRGAITERTYWLIEHHMDLLDRPGRLLKPSQKRQLEAHEFYDDLVALRDLDNAGRVPGIPVGTIDDAITYLKALESEAYLDEESS
jgi:predicted HD phosphohydrolase